MLEGCAGVVPLSMAKYRKLSHSIYYCVYHIVWTPKYGFRIMRDILADLVEEKIKTICAWKEVEVLELNVRADHVHIVCSIPPKLSVSDFMGILKGKTGISMFKNFQSLKKQPYWGNHFWDRGYFVSTIGIDEEKIKRNVKYQEEQEKNEEGDNTNFSLF
jgi:putative transposase